MTTTALPHIERLVKTYTNTRHGKTPRAIVIHHEAGNLTADEIAKVFSSRKSSANYSIDETGEVCLHVPEEYRAWTTGGTDPDDYSITIELANDATGEPWHISDSTISSAVQLCADICRRYGIKKLYYDGKSGTLLRHCDFKATACPGAYFKSRTTQFCDRVNILLDADNVVYTVQAGAFKNKANADTYAKALNDRGISAIVKENLHGTDG